MPLPNFANNVRLHKDDQKTFLDTIKTYQSDTRIAGDDLKTVFRMVVSRDVTFAEFQKALTDILSELLQECLETSSSVRGISCSNLGEKDEKEGMISTQASEKGDDSSQIVRESGGTIPELTPNNGTTDELFDCSGNDNGNSAGNDESGVRKYGQIRYAPGPRWANRALISTATDPTTILQAIKRPDSTLWKDLMQCDYVSLIKHETWTLVPRPVNVNVIACK
jgi:hypothetical protein